MEEVGWTENCLVECLLKGLSSHCDNFEGLVSDNSKRVLRVRLKMKKEFEDYKIEFNE